MKKHVLASAVLASLALPIGAHADEPPPSLTGNFGIFSNYVFRGITQTNSKPAIQGGFDYAHSSGFYVGTWGSNVSWLADGGYATSSSLEGDFYGGYKGTIGKTDFGYDVGAILYYYPGSNYSSPNPNTTEVYGAMSWKWITAKLSYAVTDYFGTANSDGTYYLDVSASYPIGKTGVTVLGHVGSLKVAGTGNDAAFSYTDWKAGASYGLPKDYTVGAYVTGNNATAASYTVGGKDWSATQYVVYVQKTF